MDNLELLRWHLDAVWSLSLPPLDSPVLTLSPTEPLPPWQIYHARLGTETRTVWRPEVSADERAVLLYQATLVPQDAAVPAHFRHEVVLVMPADITRLTNRHQHSTRLLTEADRSLLEVYDLGYADYFLGTQAAPCIGVIIDGQLVSVAHSSRQTTVACELGIDTLPAVRQHGYALAATQAWTTAVYERGRIPIYSAMATNIPSLRLAAAAGYQPIAQGSYSPLLLDHDE